MHKKTKIMSAALVAGAIVIGCIAYFTTTKEKSDENVILVTKVSTITQGGLVSVDRFSGIVEAQSSVDYKKDASKTIASVNVSEGQQVKKDDVLFTYNVSDAQNQINSLNLDIEELSNDIASLNDQIAELNNQKANAAQEDILSYTTQIQTKQTQIRSDQYDIQAKQNEIKRHQAEIDNASVKATIDGVVKSVHSDGGFDTNGQEYPIVSLTQSGNYRIKGTLDEQAIGVLTVGMNVIVRSRLNPEEIWNGSITQLDSEPTQQNTNVYGPSNGESASLYNFYVALGSSEGLLLGQHIYVEPDFGQGMQKEGIWLDQSYISYDEDGNPYIWLAKNDKLTKQSVTLGETNDQDFTVQITEGLSLEDAIAWPEETFKEGMKVKASEDLFAGSES